MKRIYSIYLLCLSLLLIPGVARALSVWNGVTTSTALECLDPTLAAGAAGSGNNPYLIASGADLAYLCNTTSLWSKCFRQTESIDLAGHPLPGPIGYGKNSSSSESSLHPFTGTYDGCGKELRNLTIDWSVIDGDRHLAFGLFGYVSAATIQNIMLVHPRLERLSSTVVNSSVADIKLSLLIGAASSAKDKTTHVRNIAIVDGLITDSGRSPEARTLFVGPVIADITVDFENANNMRVSTAGKLDISNLSVDCDIDLDASQRRAEELSNPAHYTQFNVGGMVGRIRRGRYDILPVNTFFRGDVKAPGGTVSPTVGVARGNGDNSKSSYYLTRAYLGEVMKTDEATDTGNDSYYLLDNNELTLTGYENKGITADAGHYFGPYRVWDYDPEVNDYVTFNATSPTEGAYGSRTIATNTFTTKNSRTYDPVDPMTWRYFQGVNHGNYAALTDDGNAEVLNMFNKRATDNALTPWVYSPLYGTFALSSGTRVSIDRPAFATFTAQLEEYFGAEEVQYRWELLPAGASDYVDKGTTTTPSFTLADGDDVSLYTSVRVTVLYADGTPLLSGSDPVADTAEILSLDMWGNIVMEKEMLNAVDFRYVVSLFAPDGTLLMGGAENALLPGYTWVWAVTSDPTNCNSWESTDLPSGQNWIQPYRTDRYYRASVVRISDNAALASAIGGPKKVIFVYDTEMTAMGREIGVTTFDGIDLSQPLDPTPTYYPDGDDRNTGYDPYHAVKSMTRAYELATADVGYDENLIVVMGYICDPDLWVYAHTAFFNKNVTITGNPTGMISGGALNVSNFGADTNVRALGGHTKMENISIVGYTSPPTRSTSGTVTRPSTCQLFLYCCLHDLYIGEGVNIKRYTNLSTANGQLDGTTAPGITIIGGFHNPNTLDPIVYPEGNETPGVVTITLNSGCWGRIIGGSRNHAFNPVSHNIYGSPENPHRVTVNVSISHPLGLGTKEYAESNTKYTYDIGLLVGGQTDGTIYTDCQMNVNAGTVGRFLSGNISFGRAVGDGYPSDSFFGSCEVTLLGGEITELYGGTLGRRPNNSDNTYTDLCEAYFYGRSIININGGTIRSNIYGGGAGGVTGIGHCSSEEHHGHHTTDQCIPYYDSATGQLTYGDFYAARTGTIPTITLRDGTVLDLDDSYCAVNINSGTIYGNVYGGGYGFSTQISQYTRALTQAGDVFGNVSVTLRSPYPQPPVVKGSIYGGGAGSSKFYEAMVADLITQGTDEAEARAQAAARFGDLARIFGNTSVELYGGTVEGNVYGGSMGVGMFNDMATIFGNAHVTVDGATVLGNIFGGCAFANIKKGDVNPEVKGNTTVDIRSGIIGNNIFGGSEGTDDYSTLIEGSTSVNILGGSYLADPSSYSYRDPATGTTSMVERTFNIYGGSYHSGVINESTNVYIERSLLCDPASIATVESTSPADADENYRNAISDISYRRFCVYGGGYGALTTVLRSATVNINIVGDQVGGVIVPTPDFPSQLAIAQTFFDVAGGGYNGNVGRWMAQVTDPVTGLTTDVPVSSLDNPRQSDYAYYDGGDVFVTIQGSPFIRKVIGGGFYASVNNAETWIKSGTIKSVFGGGLLGYVHNNARMAVGTHGRLAGDSPAQEFTLEMEEATAANSHLFIVEDVYGGNDVTGIVGTELYRSSDPLEADIEIPETVPLFAADVSPDTHKGVLLNIYGGTIGGDVYGAGNGHYRGYYVPEWTRYNQGAASQYRYVRTNKIERDADDNITNARVDEDGNTFYVGKAYRARPMAGSVKVNIAGNSDGDRVNILGSVYGGGRSCTIGSWNTLLPFEDPRRLDRGGYLQMNIGSHVTITNNLYLGSRGNHYNTLNTVPADVAPLLTPGNHFGDNFTDLNRLGAIAYDHWWWNTTTSRYEPGFPPPGQVEGNYGYTGEHSFRAYMKNIEMNGDVELTFYNDLYQRDASGEIILDANGEMVRKTWVPGELALLTYDSSDVYIHSFFLGGECGSMTNNRVMRYDYDLGKPVEDGSAASADVEGWGSIYRVTIPMGVTLQEKVVGGSDNATAVVYPYNADFTEVTTTDGEGNDCPLYTFVGGIVTQCNYTYDLIVYCDRQRSFNLDVLPSQYMMAASDPAYSSYTLTYGPDAGKTIYRYPNPLTPLLTNLELFNTPYGRQRYSLAVAKTADNLNTGYIGTRESRDAEGDAVYGKTAVKMSLANNFVLMCEDESIPDDDPEKLKHIYGGLIYGGCYNSGNTIGHVIINVGSNLLGPRITNQNEANFGELSGLSYNVGRVYGGGYGENTLIDGNTYINLLHNFKGMNVFGGGCRGNVTGTANVVYLGSESTSYIYGAIYGGALQGQVGTENETIRATRVNLYSGNVDKVYGGSCMGDIYGGTFVELCDQVTQAIDHLDYDRLLNNMGWASWSGSRLIVGSVYGGNDVSGSITVPASATDKYAYETTIHMYEVQDTTPSSHDGDEGEGGESGEGGGSEDPEGPGKTSPGSENGYNGFPLVGNLYGGSNGDYGTTAGGDHYTGGSLWLATGEGTTTQEIKLGGVEGSYPAFEIPVIPRTHVVLNGGTIINAYGGGNQATVTERAHIEVAYIPGDIAAGDPGNRHARAGFSSREELTRVWYTLHLTSAEQIEEVCTIDVDNSSYVFDYQVFRLFGGNEVAEMSIQPEWNLQCGYIGSLYSGGNFGRMTYFNPTPGPGESHGLSLTIDSRNLHANYVYGGGRVGAIDPAVPDGWSTTTFYGATLNILDGVIDHVYGGNDVAGEVYYGSNVNIHGAISGDVYCAGNGNYRYFYDPTLPTGSKIEEMYDDNVGGRYFRLPLAEGFGGTTPVAAQRILAINSYRPNVDKAWLNIGGNEGSMAYVRGNVYCGGNSSTIIGETLGVGNSQIRFTIGDYVTLNGVFLGSNGYWLADGSMISVTEQLNGIDLTKASDLSEAAALATPADHDAADRSLYPTLLDLYMRAVDVNGVPSGFDLGTDLTEAYIGDFYLGGNRGSMLTDRTISLTFPEALVIYGKIVGGSDNACLSYKGTTHVGGLIRPLADPTADKVHLVIKNRFEPWHLHYPLNDDERFITMETALETDSKSGLAAFPDRTCNVYGGCYNSGRTVGGIRLDIYSDMAGDYAPGSAIAQSLADIGVGSGTGMISKQRAIANGISGSNSTIRRSFAVIGGGYGQRSEVYGDINVRLLPIAGEARPSVAAIFGGMQEGTLVGNTCVELRDGLVLTNLYGASEAAPMYGSTQVIVGYPDYYRCDVGGEYTLQRTDTKSKAALGDWVNDDGYSTPVIQKTIKVRRGDIISRRVYDIITTAGKESCFTLVDGELPADFGAALTWDDIQIAVGDPSSKTDPDAEYLGHGNIYGGGFVSAGSVTSLAGQNTVCSFTETDGHYLDIADVGRGGNSTILVWDNKRNARFAGEVTEGDDGNGAAVRDHIDVATSHYVLKEVEVGTQVMGLWRYDAASNRFEHTAPHILTAEDVAAGNRYYTIESDGGIYGDGRKVLVENFRDVDIAYYGYAQGTPQRPKLINTAQHIDLLSISDCCIHFQGAHDFATNSVDATVYSLTRIGELQMLSSLSTALPLDKGDIDVSNGFNTRHDTPRSRNFIAFFNDVRYVGAVTSNVDFSAPFHNRDGLIPDAALTYQQNKEQHISDYYSIINSPTLDDDARVQAAKEFDRRNVGTAANMIGINNGYVLRVQGVAERQVGTTSVDETYFGPVTGVFEVKLLTLTEGEGGGYIFALNHHDNPASFLESTGNFVFPGAAYNVSEAASRNYNYVRDDCFPMGAGWETYWGWNETSTYTAGEASGEGEHGDCNELEECHYWYVNGTKYYYNVTLTGYTSSLDEEFTFDNTAGIVYLYGVEPGAKITVQEVEWESSTNPAPDLTFSDPDDRAANLYYRFYLTIDKDPDVVRTPQTDPALGGNWYVTAIPRANYSADTGTTVDVAAMPTAPDDPINNAYGDDNIPQVGISLVDHHHGNVGREYYTEHLADDEKVRIVLTTGEGLEQFTYTINLTVKYLLGPTITGVPTIENCALPGEYIYANSYGVEVDLDDENMMVSSRNWYMASQSECSTDTEGHLVLSRTTAEDIVKQMKGLPHYADHVAMSLNDNKFGNDRQVFIPAFRHLDDWRLIYEIVINGESFLMMPDALLAGEADVPHYADRLVVHNYHRMFPYDGTSILTDDSGNPIDEDGNPVSAGHYVKKIQELYLTEGARIYIEDDTDMAYFFKWLRQLQNEPTTTTPDGATINPRYAEGLEVYLMNDVSTPAGVNGNGLIFRGVFYGSGHYINMDPSCDLFLANNQGRFYDTGFITTSTSESLRVFGANGDAAHPGTIENCYFYNDANALRGALISGAAAGNIVNCFATGVTDTRDSNGIRFADHRDFGYGKIAFNLNRFYLKKRYNLACSVPDGELLAPLMEYYNDGEYRFARWSTRPSGTALRTVDVPNYHDYRGVRIDISTDYDGTVTGLNATHHDCTDTPDETRLDTESGLYFPIFPDDYLFFGQDLSLDHTSPATDAIPYTGVPMSLTEQNRVYRASGFYGAVADQGYHFNLNAVAKQPELTAIDFAGYRDRQLGERYFIEDESDAYAEYLTWQPDVYYPPMLDLPEELLSMTTAENVTHNLLIYAPEDDPSNPLTPVLRPALEPLVYTLTTPESDIRAHLLTTHLPATGAPTEAHRPTTRLQHLVDLHNFHCPIEYEVTDTIWYQREPQVFASSVGNAWEGLCLPFNVRAVWGTIAQRDGLSFNSIRDRGELTHFFGADDSRGYYRLVGDVLTPVEGYEDEAPSHEYWLRKFTHSERDGSNVRLYFCRPDGDDDVASNGTTAYTTRQGYRRNYFYSNPAFSTVYGQGYGEELTHSRPCYTSDGAVYDPYPLISAGLPYIVAYPGEAFYEFDMSGRFYADHFTGAPEVPQLVTYGSVGSAHGEKPVIIPVTVGDHLLAVKHGDYTFCGTYTAIQPGTDATFAVINEGDGSTSFVANASATIQPFRTYIQRSQGGTDPLLISGRSSGTLEGEIVDPQSPDDDGDGDDDGGEALMEIYVEFNELVIQSPWATDLTIYNVAGQAVRQIHVDEGINRYRDLAPGVYLVLSTKFLIN